MKTRSGREFSPYGSENISMANVEQDFPLETVVDVASLLQAVTHLEDENFANGGDDTV